MQKGVANLSAEITHALHGARLDRALVHALDSKGWANFSLKDYRSHALTAGSESSAAAYVSLQSKDGRTVWGCGVDANIELAGLKALVSAANRLG